MYLFLCVIGLQDERIIEIFEKIKYKGFGGEKYPVLPKEEQKDAS